jgi:transcriptional regulator with PAS, ATPase and Fis domain
MGTRKDEQTAVQQDSAGFAGMVGQSPALLDVFDLIKTAAQTSMSVLLTGETGSGKELAARAIHDHSARRDQSFLKVDCTALPDTLLESELFGYKKGAFTDARFNKPGKLEMADGGTAFLDEIGEIPLAVQAKLLRLIEEHAFEPLGGVQTVRVDVRIIAATNKDLLAAVEKGDFRKDLFYRLNEFPVKVPPLRDRTKDIPLLAAHFLQRLNNAYKRGITNISPAVSHMFEQFSWPGNIRQLKHALEYAYLRCKSGTIEIADLPDDIAAGNAKAASRAQSSKIALEPIERDTILHTLQRNHLRIARTARELNISRTTLWRKMKKYNIIK